MTGAAVVGPPGVLAHAGELHAAQWAALAAGALVPLAALIVIVVLSERRR